MYSCTVQRTSSCWACWNGWAGKGGRWLSPSCWIVYELLEYGHSSTVLHSFFYSWMIYLYVTVLSTVILCYIVYEQSDASPPYRKTILFRLPRIDHCRRKTSALDHSCDTGAPCGPANRALACVRCAKCCMEWVQLAINWRCGWWFWIIFCFSIYREY